MSDRISTYRQVRLVLQVPRSEDQRAYYSLHAIGVYKGIPTARILVDGTVSLAPLNPTTEEILEALDAAVRQSML